MRKKQTREGPAFFEPCGGISDDGTHERIRTSGLPLRSSYSRFVPRSTRCLNIPANPHESRISLRTTCYGVLGGIVLISRLEVPFSRLLLAKY